MGNKGVWSEKPQFPPQSLISSELTQSQCQPQSLTSLLLPQPPTSKQRAQPQPSIASKHSRLPACQPQSKQLSLIFGEQLQFRVLLLPTQQPILIYEVRFLWLPSPQRLQPRFLISSKQPKWLPAPQPSIWQVQPQWPLAMRQPKQQV